MCNCLRARKKKSPPKILTLNSTSTREEVIIEMTKKRLGATAVTDDNNVLLGIITDGDLRRMARGALPCTIGKPATDAELEIFWGHAVRTAIVCPLRGAPKTGDFLRRAYVSVCHCSRYKFSFIDVIIINRSIKKETSFHSCQSSLNQLLWIFKPMLLPVVYVLRSCHFARCHKINELFLCKEHLFFIFEAAVNLLYFSF